jgi:hypothetical protein
MAIVARADGLIWEYEKTGDELMEVTKTQYRTCRGIGVGKKGAGRRKKKQNVEEKLKKKTLRVCAKTEN